MLDYSKARKKLRKSFPDLPEEEIDNMLLQLPPEIPLVVVDALIVLTKASLKNPAKLEELKNTKVTPSLIDQIHVEQSGNEDFGNE